MRVNNTNVFVYSSYESIIIDNISVNGITNFGIEIKNNSSVGNVTNVSIYGSPNGTDYYLSDNDIFGSLIGPGALKHVEFALVTGFIRVSVQTDANINIDVYVHGNMT